MLRGGLLEQQRCYNHPHRITEQRCSRCRMSFCEFCLHEVPPAERPPARADPALAPERARSGPADARYCDECAAELRRFAAAAQTENRPFWQWRPSRAALRNWLLGTFIVAIVVVPAWFVAGEAAKTPLTAEEAARIAVGLRGGFTSLEGTNVLLSVYGGSYVGTNVPSQDGHGPSALIDSFWQANVADWRSEQAEFPAELVFRAALNSSMGKLILRVSPDSPPESWPRDFELLISVTGPDSGYRSVLQATFPRERSGAAAEGRYPPPRGPGAGAAAVHVSRDPGHLGDAPYPVQPRTPGLYLARRGRGLSGRSATLSIGQ